jgi:glycosyltransferase involved in cell wall biosynthesis
MNYPLISIVVCTYNRAEMLKQTMETIFAQKYRPVEIVVVDDGSTDSTKELIASYGDRVRYYRQENKGIAAARNIGCKLARGEYIAFQDDDDLMPPNRIVCLLKALRQYPNAVIALGDWVFIDAEGKLTGERSKFKIRSENINPILIEDGYKAVLWSTIVPTPHNTLFRKADGNRIGWFDTRFFHGCSDMDFFARLGQLGPIVYVPEVVSYFRRGHLSIWDKKNELLGEYSFFLLFEKHLKSLNIEQKDLKKRLKLRMLSVLMRIAFLKSRGLKVSHSIPEDYLKRGLSLLDIKGVLRYSFYTLIRIPLRKLIKSH